MTKKPTGKRAASPSRKAPAKKAPPARKPPARSKAKAEKEPERRKYQPLDWEAIERDYRTGKFTLRELADKYGTNDATIGRRITDDRKKDQTRWQKDLRDVVRRATDAKVMNALLEQQQVSEGQQRVSTAVQAAAEIGAKVILGQQERVRSAIDVVMRMLAELDATTMKADEIHDAFDRIISSELSGPALVSAQQQFREFMRLHNRIGSVHKLMDALTKAQAQEAKAFGLERDGGQGEGDSFEDRVADMEGELPP